MFRFFRQIRHRLLADNRVRKYLLYAIGEIFLVVIGILIALQLDNWNSDRKNALEVKAALMALQNEMDENIDYLEARVSEIEDDLGDIEKYLELMNTPHPEQLHDSVVVNMIQQLGPFTFTPLREKAYNNVINSGLINYITDDSLKLNLIDIERGYQRYEDRRANLGKVWEFELKPYYLEHADLLAFLKNLGDSIYQKPVPQTYYELDRDAFVNNRKLSNILALRSLAEKSAKSTFTRMVQILKNYKEDIDAYLKSASAEN